MEAVMRNAVVLCVALLLPGAARAAVAEGFETRCEREMRPVLEVRAREATFDLTNTVSSKVLNARLTYASSSQLTLGMTSGTSRIEIALDAPALRDRSGIRECVSPRVYVDLSYSPLRVFVAREFHEKSCAYRTVYTHEMQHVQVYRQHLPLLEQRVREALQQRYGDRPLYSAAGTGLKRLERDVDEWLRPFIKDRMGDIERQQALLDTPEESSRLSHACLGEVESAMGSSF
jgi:hypothetical protein